MDEDWWPDMMRDSAGEDPWGEEMVTVAEMAGYDDPISIPVREFSGPHWFPRMISQFAARKSAGVPIMRLIRLVGPARVWLVR